MNIQVLVFMSEIKFDLTMKENNKFSVSFMFFFFSQESSFDLLFDSHVRKLTFFLAISRQFGLVQRD